MDVTSTQSLHSHHQREIWWSCKHLAEAKSEPQHRATLLIEFFFSFLFRRLAFLGEFLNLSKKNMWTTISKPKCRENLLQKGNVNIVLELVYKSSYADILQRQSSWVTQSHVRLLVFRILHRSTRFSCGDTFGSPNSKMKNSIYLWL